MKKKWSECEIDLLIYLFIEEKLVPTEIQHLIDRPLAGIRIKIGDLKLKHEKQDIHERMSKRCSGSGNGMYGKKSWSNGLTKENDLRLQNAGEKQSKTKLYMFENNLLERPIGERNGMYGKEPWCKGLTIHTSEILKNSGSKISIKQRENWTNYSEKEKEKRRIQWAKAGLLCNKKDTSIELKIENILKDNNIIYEKQKQIGRFRVDFFVNNKVIECLGDYWHANPLKYPNHEMLNETQINNLKRDKNKLIMLSEKNIEYILLWEYDINNNLENIELDLLNFISL